MEGVELDFLRQIVKRRTMDRIGQTSSGVTSPSMSFKPFKCFPGPRDMANMLSSLFTRSVRRVWQCQVYVRHLFVHLCTGSLPSGTVDGGIGSNKVVNKFAEGLLELAVGLNRVHTVESNPSGGKSGAPYLLEVGTVVTRSEPRRFGVRNQ